MSVVTGIVIIKYVGLGIRKHITPGIMIIHYGVRDQKAQYPWDYDNYICGVRDQKAHCPWEYDN